MTKGQKQALISLAIQTAKKYDQDAIRLVLAENEAMEKALEEWVCDLPEQHCKDAICKHSREVLARVRGKKGGSDDTRSV